MIKIQFEKLKTIFKMDSIQKKILIGMISVSLGIIIFISLIVGFNAQKSITRSSIEDSGRYVTNIKSNLDLVLKMVEKDARSIASNADIQSILMKNNQALTPANFTHTQEIKEELVNIIGSNNIIDAAVIYDLNGNVYTSGVEVLRDRETPYIQKRMTWQDMRINVYKSHNILLRKNNLYTTTLHTPVFSYTTGKLIGVLELHIPELYIKELYASENTGESSEVFILSESGLIQSSSLEEYSSRDMSGYISLLKGEQGYFINNKTLTLVSYEKSNKANWYILEEIWLSQLYKRTHETIRSIILISVLGLISSIIFSTIISKSITRPLHSLTSAIKSIRHGNLNTELEASAEDEVGVLTREFNKMLTNQNNLINRLVEEETRQQRYALELTQDQVNAHFLYNTLDNICALAELDRKEELISMVQDLSDFYRGVLSKGETLITIGKEVSILTLYIKILNTRYRNKFSYSIEWDQALSDFMCPKLLLQPIVENAIYHGIKLKKQKGHIDICISEQGNCIVFSIEDNGIGMDSKKINKVLHQGGSNFGVKGTDERVKLYYGKEYGLNISSSPGKGTLVTITTSKKVMNQGG